MKTSDQINKLNTKEELKYYKVDKTYNNTIFIFFYISSTLFQMKNNEFEKNLMFKEQEIHNLENRYQQLSQYCESFLKKNASI